jgi:hypothetical protein
VGLGMIFSLAMPENQDWDTINELTEHCEIWLMGFEIRKTGGEELPALVFITATFSWDFNSLILRTLVAGLPARACVFGFHYCLQQLNSQSRTPYYSHLGEENAHIGVLFIACNSVNDY